MPEKKYQIFVSSTYTDLKAERQSVSKAILDLGHIPAGMELFPAASKSQIDYIKKVINDCDYYVVISGSRYGSVNEEGLSYTEQEFEYAASRKIPILAFLHDDLQSRAVRDSDTDEELYRKLELFRERLQTGWLTKYWQGIGDLTSNVITSLTSAFSDDPQVGWRRDTEELSSEALREIQKAKNSSSHWYKAYNEASEKVKSYEDLRDSQIEIRFFSDNGPSQVRLTGEDLIRELAASLNHGTDESEIRQRLFSYVQHKEDSSISEVDPASVSSAVLFLKVFEIINSSGYGESLELREDKRYLLKAAFRPLAKVMDEWDELPF